VRGQRGVEKAFNRWQDDIGSFGISSHVENSKARGVELTNCLMELWSSLLRVSEACDGIRLSALVLRPG